MCVNVSVGQRLTLRVFLYQYSLNKKIVFVNAQGQKHHNALELELQAVLSCLMWVLGTQVLLTNEPFLGTLLQSLLLFYGTAPH